MKCLYMIMVGLILSVSPNVGFASVNLDFKENVDVQLIMQEKEVIERQTFNLGKYKLFLPSYLNWHSSYCERYDDAKVCTLVAGNEKESISIAENFSTQKDDRDVQEVTKTLVKNRQDYLKSKVSGYLGENRFSYDIKSIDGDNDLFITLLSNNIPDEIDSVCFTRIFKPDGKNVTLISYEINGTSLTEITQEKKNEIIKTIMSYKKA